jgi:uncharacterized protein (DUF488 family)
MSLPATTNATPTLYTVGHSNRSWDDFLTLVTSHDIATIADVRRFPGSRRLPQFNDGQLAHALPASGIDYLPCPDLGGRRKPNADSVNTGWRNDSFRAYADYMQTEAFLTALEELIRAASRRPTAVMCAEAVPWRCHRSLIADAMLVRGWRVLDIMSPTSAKPHKLTPFARVNGTQITYPPEQATLPFPTSPA